jgi:hypothetical protein
MYNPEKKLPAARTPYDQESLQRQITATDASQYWPPSISPPPPRGRPGGGFVYELYGLTEEEIGIAEGK